MKPASFGDFKRVQKMSLNQFNRWIASVYESGFVDGMEMSQGEVVAEIGEADLLNTIMSIKGIGQKRAEAAVAAILAKGINDNIDILDM